MTTIEAWLPDLKQAAGAKYQVIADALESAVGDGRLRGGDRLPPQRDLAQRLGIDLTTVTKAYDVARQRGVIEARGRLGSFVREPGDTGFTRLDQVDAAMNMPPEPPEGALARAIADGTTALLRHGSGARLQYQPPGGALQDRVAGAALIKRICAPTIAEQVVLTAGGQHALHAILSMTLAPGDTIACGRYVYTGLKALAARLGLKLAPLPEMSAAALAEALRTTPIRALYLVPTNDNPTTLTLDRAEREALAAVARGHDLQVIEDDAYALLAAERLAPVTAFAPENCWYIASTSKIVSPALRVAYVRAPSVGAALRLASEVHETAIMAPPINAALVTGWIGSGTLDALVAEMRTEVKTRRALAGQVLKDVPYRAHPEGYHLWVPLPAGLTGSEAAEAMRGTDLHVAPALRFAASPDLPDDAVRISLGGIAGHDAIRHALRTLQGHIAQPERRSAAFLV